MMDESITRRRFLAMTGTGAAMAAMGGLSGGTGSGNSLGAGGGAAPQCAGPGGTSNSGPPRGRSGRRDRKYRPGWRDQLESLLNRYDSKRALVRKSNGHALAQHSPRLAELLLRRNAPGDANKAVAIIEAVLAEQFSEPGPEYGRFPMMVPETWRDLNGTLFLMSSLVAIVEEHAHLLPDDLVARLERSLEMAAVAAERRWQAEVFDVHRDFVAYSNIFALYVQSLMLLARHFDDERLTMVAEGQWRRWFNHVSYYGIDEFVSRNYNGVVLNTLLRMEPAAPSDQIRREINMVTDFLLGMQFGLHHPVLELPISGASRDYRQFVEPGRGALGAIASGEADTLAPRAVVQEHHNRTYPYTASGRAAITPFRFTTWQTLNAGLGSMTGGHYFAQHLHLLAAVGTSPADRAVAYMNADRMMVTNGWVAQADNRALCLFARTPTSYHYAQLGHRPGGPPTPRSNPPSLGLTEAWTIHAGDDNFALRAYGHTLHVYPFAIEGGRARSSRWREEAPRDGREGVRVLRGEEERTYAGCVLELRGPDEHGRPERPAVTASMDEDRIKIREGGGLGIDLARMPTGEFVELYDVDWRTLPLFKGPAYELWPGELTYRAASEA